MTALAVWCVAGFLWVFFFPARDVPSQWAQLFLGGPLIWATTGILYLKGTDSLDSASDSGEDHRAHPGHERDESGSEQPR